MKFLGIIALTLFTNFVGAQSLQSSIQQRMLQIEKDPQFKHAAISFYVLDAENNSVVYEKNRDMGLAPASCQKVITSVAAFELLGQKYSFATNLEYTPSLLANGIYNGVLTIKGNGDPTLGSNRYSNTAQSVLQKWITALDKAGIKKINDLVVADDGSTKEDRSLPPKGYIWEDLGNYYGANSWPINWRENQYDINFKTEGLGTRAKILSIFPKQPNVEFVNTVVAKGNSDEAYINSTPYANFALINGTIPPNKSLFTVSGAMQRPAAVLLAEFREICAKRGILGPKANFVLAEETAIKTTGQQKLITIQSPQLDSINYWFLKKSVNLFGECFLKQMGNSQNLEKGVNALTNFYQSKVGVNPEALNILDGSGLSPSNRITTAALVQVLQYASEQNWYPLFYNALPIMNDMHMKDGYIGGVRSYAGYHKAANGKKYVFAFMVNNFSGSPATAREKIWRLLDLLK